MRKQKNKKQEKVTKWRGAAFKGENEGQIDPHHFPITRPDP